MLVPSEASLTVRIHKGDSTVLLQRATMINGLDGEYDY